jgi:ubiquinone/menaquinone biosynthesis C-methylase UbiE
VKANGSFAVPAEAYDRYIGRYSRRIAPRFLAFAGVAEGPAVDVGCGPGSLTEVLAQRFGASSVAAVDLSEPFVAACRARVPGADVRRASAEELPFSDRTFQAALSQLVLSFVGDPSRAAAEMSRVVRPSGTVAACTFQSNGFALARTFWEAALRVDAKAPDDARLPFRRLPELVELWERARFRDVATEVIEVEVDYGGFDDFWAPFAFGIGPAGGYLVAQPEDRRAAIREACFEALGRPERPFSMPARVLAIRGRV